MKIVNNLNDLTDQLTIVDFFATWCGPCKMLAPVLEDIAIDVKDIEILKVDVDQAEELANAFNIYAVPTLIMFKNKEAIDMKQGYVTYNDLMAWINEHK